MTDTRENFINTLKETAEIAEACGEMEAASILLGLAASLKMNLERKMCNHVSLFTLQMLARIEAANE